MQPLNIIADRLSYNIFFASDNRVESQQLHDRERTPTKIEEPPEGARRQIGFPKQSHQQSVERGR